METLQVSLQAANTGSKHSSRTPSPSREKINKDREANDSSASAGILAVSRFRSQSPSKSRVSRDRERLEKQRDKEKEACISDAKEMSAEHHENFEDTRSGHDDINYSSFTSEEVDSHLANVSQISGESEHKSGFYKGHHRTSSSLAFDRITTKIACTKELIKKEQTARDDNVNEYLKLAANADKAQLQRIKAVFEKKNQKSAHNISQLQKKLESYNKRYKDLQSQQTQKIQQQQGHRQPREMLRDVGQGLRNVGGNIRDGVTGLSATVMSKPREFAHLIKNKFGSADNINQLSSNPNLQDLNLNNSSIDNTAAVYPYHGSSTSNNTAAVNMASNTSGSGGGLGGGGGGSGKYNSEHDSECSSVTSDSIPMGSGKNQLISVNRHFGNYKAILSEIQGRKEDYDKMKERVDRLEVLQKEVSDLGLALESERYRAERLEDQINDLTELHQNEIENLKSALADMEEKVQYQSDERLRDVNEILENCQTRISKMEHLSQQQYVTVEGIDNSNARALVVKLINVVLTVLQVVLLLVATAAGIIMPFLKTRVRVLTTVFFIIIVIFIVRQWPDVRDIGSHMVKYLKNTFTVK